jgi:tRNA pseudouridine38-40 synthase
VERNIKLIIGYDGTAYHGWQKQPNRNTVQGAIEEVIQTVFKEKVLLQGASRTDAGVHAEGQVANFKITKKIPAKKIKAALNSKLPKDIVVIKVKEVPDSFNARMDAKGKHYRYVILNNKLYSPFEKNYSLFFPYDLDVDNMQSGADYFIGAHDFASFAVNPGKDVSSTVRTIYSIKVTKKKKKVYIDIKGNSFLYKMVRSMVGTLLEVGRGRKDPEDIKRILVKKNRNYADKTVSSSGLYLKEVLY